ncbi:MAG: glycosyltransferase [bacterium]
MSDTPLVSVVCASYNMGHYLVEAVDSVLNQTYDNLEVIVVNDGSTDDTLEVLATYADNPRVIAINQENAGQTKAKNRGLQEARGELVGFCDADNAWLPDKLARQVPYFAEPGSLGVVYGDIVLMDDKSNDLSTPAIERHSGRITGRLLASNFVTFNTTLVPRRILEEVDGFDESLSMGIDYDLWLRISVNYEFLYLPQTLARYRIWGGQMSHRTGERMDNFFRLLAGFLEKHPDSVTPAEANRAWAHSLTTRGRWHASMGNRGEAWQDYRQALQHRPLDLRTWKSLGRLLAGAR